MCTAAGLLHNANQVAASADGSVGTKNETGKVEFVYSAHDFPAMPGRHSLAHLSRELPVSVFTSNKRPSSSVKSAKDIGKSIQSSFSAVK
jgi:hypothetical protein